jgi:hypothetical protein
LFLLLLFLFLSRRLFLLMLNGVGALPAAARRAPLGGGRHLEDCEVVVLRVLVQREQQVLGDQLLAHHGVLDAAQQRQLQRGLAAARRLAERRRQHSLRTQLSKDEVKNENRKKD